MENKNHYLYYLGIVLNLKYFLNKMNACKKKNNNKHNNEVNYEHFLLHLEFKIDKLMKKYNVMIKTHLYTHQ